MTSAHGQWLWVQEVTLEWKVPKLTALREATCTGYGNLTQFIWMCGTSSIFRLPQRYSLSFLIGRLRKAAHTYLVWRLTPLWKIYGLPALLEGDGFTNAQCMYLPIIVGADLLMCASNDECDWDTPEYLISLPCAHRSVATRTDCGFCVSGDDAGENSPVLVTGILLWLLRRRPQFILEFNYSLGCSQWVRDLESIVPISHLLLVFGWLFHPSLCSSSERIWPIRSILQQRRHPSPNSREPSERNLPVDLLLYS
jgi:hypothetical protein